MKTVQSGSKKLLLIVSALFVVSSLIAVMTKGCSEDGSSSDIYVAAPGVPTNFVVAATSAGGDLSATLAWSAPTTGGATTSYEIYRSNSGDNVFSPDNFLLSLPATTFEFIDNAGLERGVTTYWVVAAKNAGGETPTLPEEYTPSGSGGGEVEGYGNNFGAALIFADGYGISGLELNTSKSWTDVVADIDYNTGLRPVIEENASALPYFDENTTFVKDGVTYYKQKTASTWQGEWQNGKDTDQNVTATWGDNLISQTLNTESIVRVEMVLSKALDTNMTSYKMVSLYGTKEVEIYGTDGTTYENNTSLVFATNARLTIEEVDENNITGAVVEDQRLFDPTIEDGPGKFGAEVTVSGNVAYGYVWDLKQNPVAAGKYRITFSLDGTSVPTGTPNNTYIKEVGVPEEGDPSTFPVLVSDTEVYIDITIH